MRRRATSLAAVSLGVCLAFFLVTRWATRLELDSRARGVEAGSGSTVIAPGPGNVEPPGGAWVEPGTPSSSESGRPSASPLETPGRKAVSSPVRGRVEDQHTGEAIASIWVVVETESKRRFPPVLTDSGGGFELPPLPHGTLRATLREPVRDVALGVREPGPWIELENLEFDHGPEPSTWILRAKIGPTFPLVLAPAITGHEVAGRVHEFRADGSRVAWGWQRAHWNSGWILRYPYPQGIGEPDADSHWHLEVQAVPWDSRAQERLASGTWGGPFSMEWNRTDPGIAWSGLARLDGVRGRHRTVHVDLESQLGVRGRVIDLRGEGVVGAEVQVRSLDHGREAPEPMLLSTREAGRFAAFPLPPGNYHLDVKHPGHVPRGRDFRLAAGSQVLPPLELERSREGGAVTGTVILRGHTTVLTVGVNLRSLGAVPFQGMQFIEVAPPEPTDLAEPDSGLAPGVPRGEFRFEDVPPGPCEIDLLVVPSYPSSPSPLRTESPASGLEFEIDGSTLAHIVTFRPRDAETGAAIDRFHLHCDVGGRWMPSARRATFGGRGWPWHEDSSFRWRISAEGYRSRRGTDQDIVHDGEAWVVETELERGWSASLLFRDVGSMDTTWFESPDDELEIFRSPPVEGVQVFVDGHEHARSDPEGLVVLDLDRAPTHIEFRHPEWRLERSDTYRDGRLTIERPPALLWMRRIPE